MKQPKFRGFSRETNKWHYGHGWFEIDYTDEFLKEKGIEQQAMLYTEGYPVECELSSMGQFTGLKDAIGKEIYEGDIVSVTPLGGMDKSTYHGIFEWVNGGFQIKSSREEFSLFNGYTPYASYFDGIVIGCEVIGNIYEKPELF